MLDNGSYRDPGCFLTILRAGRPEHTPEAEGVLVVCDGSSVHLELDDGDVLTFDRVELLRALTVKPAAQAA
jgi:hypothetical protein